MTVIVKYDQEGKPQYRSAKGIGSTEPERIRANQLDTLLKEELKKLKKILTKNGSLIKNTKGNVALYWKLGNLLQEIFNNSGLIDASEKHLFWLNARLHVPEELLAKDRGPNRLHVEYCFRLAGFPKDKALKMNWGEWVYLFDSPGINREQRFDKWLEKKMHNEIIKFNRDDIRILAQSINKIMGNMETKDLSNEQLNKIYDAIWMTKNYFITKYKIAEDVKTLIMEWLEKNRLKFGKIITSEISLDEFVIMLNVS
jgi:hypothetical protein